MSPRSKPASSATERLAEHSLACFFSCSRTMRTARLRTVGYGLVVFFASLRPYPSSNSELPEPRCGSPHWLRLEVAGRFLRTSVGLQSARYPPWLPTVSQPHSRN
jgi:hypothetical protein